MLVQEMRDAPKFGDAFTFVDFLYLVWLLSVCFSLIIVVSFQTLIRFQVHYG